MAPLSSSPGDEGLSILNLDRKTLAGPEYLHALINWSSSSHAIEFWTSSGEIDKISYQALDLLSTRLARDIIAALPKTTRKTKSIVIPVLIPQSPELYISWIAILKAGAAFCPIAIDSPEERIKFILEDTKARLVLATNQYVQLLRGTASEVRTLDVSRSRSESTLTHEGTPASGIDDVPSMSPDSLAYIMYTSGSTGVPKGVKIPHRAVCQALLAHDEPIPTFERFLQFASPTFDVSVFETFFPLFRGATLVGRDREHMLADLTGTIQTLNVDAAELTPTVVGTLLRSRASAPCLKVLLTIGEMLTKPIIEEFGESPTRPGILYAMYGPTEASIHCTIAPRISTSASIHDVGQPLATVTAIIIETKADNNSLICLPLPQGQIGELAIGGQLAEGYLNRPEQTNAAFIDLPGFGTLYRTGDRGRIVSDSLELLGRMSTGQVKLRGQRVELGEIENIACRVDGVVMAVASILEDVLVLFCMEARQEVHVEVVRTICKRNLLPFMVPADIVILDLSRVPRLSSGKIDRRKIEMEYTAGKIDTGLEEVSIDDTAALVRHIVSAELGHQTQSTTSLWAQGLNSLAAIKIAAALREKQVFVSVRDLLELETIAEIVAHSKQYEASDCVLRASDLDLIEHTEAWHDLEQFVRYESGHSFDIDEIQDVLPCNDIQIAMVAQTMENTEFNFTSIELKTTLKLSLPELQVAFKRLAQKNEILRTGFISTNNSAMPFAQIVWKSLDLDRRLSLLHPLDIQSSKTSSEEFVVRIHHAIFDGWSWGIIVTDLHHLLTNQKIPEQPQFRIVSSYQRKLKLKSPQDSEDYWRSRLASVMPSEFPQLNGRDVEQPKQQSLRSTLRISTRRVGDFARSLHISLQTVLLTAISLLLSSYAGSSSAIIGLVSSGRHLPILGIERVLGPCLLTLPLCVDLSIVQTVHDLLLYVSRLQLEQLEHATSSLRDIQHYAGISVQQKLFDVLFAWQENVTPTKPSPRTLEVIESRDCLDYTLIIEAEPSGSCIFLKMTYAESVLLQKQAELFLDQLNHLVETIVADETSSLLEIWTKCDIGLLATANSEPRTTAPRFDLVSTIRRKALMRFRRVAITFVSDFNPETAKVVTQELTYRELWRRSNQTAQYLYELGIRADEVVCVLLDKSLDLYILDLAIVIAGGAFLNVDKQTPPHRMSQILREIKCKLVITADEHRFETVLHNTGQLSMPLGKLNAGAEEYRGQQVKLPTNVDGSHLAYAVMTSGTTGVPKAILVTRGNVLSNIEALSAIYPRDFESCLLQACSPAFDVFVFELFWTLHNGLRLCSTSNDVLFRDIEGFIHASGVTHLSLTPSVAALIKPANVPNVNFLVTAGEPMNSKVFSEWAGRGLYQGYGPAETTNICNVKGPVREDDLFNNVGSPLLNTSIFICAKETVHSSLFNRIQILPIGATGEIVIGGAQVARGYANHDLNRRSFIDTEYGRLYRSGDMGRLLANGDLVVLGREDDQIKLRGQRIVLGDINGTLIGNPLVADAATVIWKHMEDEARLVSFWTCDCTRQVENVSSISESLETELPPYMIPEYLVQIDSMPLTRQGKTDHKALISRLEALDDESLRRAARGADTNTQHEDFTDEEISIAKTLSDVTKIPLSKIKPTTSFYALGLDSISCVRFSQRLRQEDLGQVDVSTILRHCSLRKLAKVMAAPQSARTNLPKSKKLDDVFSTIWVSKVNDMMKSLDLRAEKVLPCTALQDSILATQATNARTSTYQAQICFQVHGDVARLKNAWSDIVTRHQILRTAFIMTPSADHPYAQVILKNFELPWYQSDEASLRETTYSEKFIMPPWYLVLIPGDVQESLMLSLSMSHVLFDFEALTLVLNEVEQIYHFQKVKPAVAPEVYYQYAQSMNPAATDAFWEDQLRDFKPFSFGELFSPAKDQAAITLSQRTYTRVSTATKHQIDKAVGEYSATISTICQAAWVRLLYCYTRKTDLCFGSVFSGRNLPIEGVDRIVAPVFNTLPIRLSVMKRQSLRDLVARLQTVALDMLPLQPSSLRRIFRRQHLNGRPLFDTLCLVQNADLILDHKIWSLHEEQGDMSFPGVIIEILPIQNQDELKLKLHVQSENIDSSTAQVILKHFDILLDEVIRYPQAQSSNFSSIASEISLLVGRASPRPEMHVSGLPSEDDDGEYANDVEVRIRRLFSQYSGVDVVKIRGHTSIFELGLDSLHVVQIAAELQNFGYNMTGANVLEARTSHRLAKLCAFARQIGTGPNQTGFDLQSFDQKHRIAVCKQFEINISQIEAVRPCTLTQSGILTEFIRSAGQLYFNRIFLELNADVDLLRMRKAWHAVVERHEMLRTGFVVLNEPQHAYGMVTYTASTTQLPWYVEADSETSTVRAFAEDWVQGMYKPCWYLLLRDVSVSRRLELYMLHALFDANSLNQLLTEVTAIYYAEDQILPAVSPIGPVLSSILSQTTASSKDSGEFWKQMAAGTHFNGFPNLNICQHHPRESTTVSYSCGLLLRDLESSCRQLGVSLQAVCQIAWARLLAAYTGEPKVIFGVVLSGRSLPEAANVVFPTINTMPFAIDVRARVEDMLHQAVEINASLFSHQCTSTYAIKKWLNTEGNLYDTLLILQREQVPQFGRPWKVIEDRATAEHAISMEILPQANNNLELRLNVQQDIMIEEHAKILLRQYEVLLREVVLESSGQSIMPNDLLSVVTAKDERIPTEIQLLHEFVERTATRSPNAIALEFADSIVGKKVTKRCWTYRQLDSESNKISHLLLSLGVRPGDFVAVCFEKCPEASFAILAVLKAGCTYVAIDPGAPRARKRFILADANCGFLLSTTNICSSLGHDIESRTLAVDDQNLFKNLPSTKPELVREVQGSDTCYCLYTSGTTGQPKGCLISHSNTVQAILSFQRIFAGHWDSSSRWLQFASFHFDVSVLEQYWSWSVGICVTSAPRELLFEDITGAIDALQITHLDLTPSLARLLEPEQLPSLCRGVFIVGGEQVTQDLIDKWGNLDCLYNFYGPSEVTIGCTVHKRVKKSVKATNIGQAWDNVGAFVLEPESEKPVLRGAVGELCLSGPLVGKGYLNQPDLTAEKFVVLKKYNTRVYRSGDLVRLLHDDSFEFLGRIDDQVKLRGQRLEVREINYCIKQADESIADVATMVVKHRDQPSEQLVSFFTVREQTEKSKLHKLISLKVTKTVAQLRRKLQDSLPAYMVPTHLVPISSIPLSVNNKADLKALRAFFEAMPMRSLQNMDWDGSMIIPASETTRKVMQILCTFLNLPESGVLPSSRLFELGLDSISTVSLANVLRSAGFAGAEAAAIMRRPIVADLADLLETLNDDDYQEAVAKAKEVIESFICEHQNIFSKLDNVESSWPCTPLQEDMLSKALHGGGASYYLSTFHYELSPVKPAAMESAWAQVQQAFPILRTRFVDLQNGHFAQAVLQKCDVPVHLRTLTSDENPLTLMPQIASAWASQTNVLSNAPCWGVDVLQTPENRLYMSLKIFHGLFDANSLSIMLDEVVHFLRNGSKVKIKAPLSFHEALPFGPLCHRAGARDFWVKHLHDFTTLNLSTRCGDEQSGPCIHSHNCALLPEYASMKSKLGVTDSAIFQATCLLSLQKLYRKMPTLGLVVSGRSFPITGVEAIGGPLFNTIPFHIRPEASWSRADLIKACHAFNVESKTYEHTSLKDIRGWIGLEPGKALFDMLFVFQKELVGGDRYNHEDLWKEVGQTTTADYPLNIEVSLRRGSFKLTIVTDPEALSEIDARLISEQFVSTLQRLVLHSDEMIMSRKDRDAPTALLKPQELTALDSALDATTLQRVKLEVGSLLQQDPDMMNNDVNLFSLGLDSIGFIKLSGALRRSGLPISVNTAMRLSTPVRISNHLSRHQEMSSSRTPQPDEGTSELLKRIQVELRGALQRQSVALDDVEQIWPVTSMQEGVLANFEKYYHFALLKLVPETEVDRLLCAWSTALEIHPVLRTRPLVIDDPGTCHTFAQLVQKPRSAKFDEIELINEQDLQYLLAQKNAQVNDAGLSFPLFDMTTVTIKNSSSQYLLLGMSHAIYDGFSIQLLHRDIFQLYNGHSVQRPPIENYLQSITGRALKIGKSFWREQILDHSPKQFSRPDALNTAAKSHKSQITSRTSVDVVRQFCMSNALSLQDLGLGIWTIVLSSCLQSRDVCFGVVLACRNGEDADELMFPTFNTVPFRPHFQEGSYLDLLKHIHDLSLRVAEHQEFPLREIKKLCSSATNNAAEPFDTLFVLQMKPTSNETLPRLYEEVGLGDDPNLDYPVNVEMEIGISLNWTVAADGKVLDEKGVKGLLEKLEAILQAILEDPHGQADIFAITEDEGGSTNMPAQCAEYENEGFRGSTSQDEGLRTAILNTVALVARCNVEILREETSIYSLGLDSISVVKLASLLRKQDVTLSVSKIMAAVTLGRILGEAKWAERSLQATEGPDTALPPTQTLQRYLTANGVPQDFVEDILPASAGQVFMLDFYRASEGRLFYPIFRYRIRGVMTEDEVIQAWDRVIDAFPALRTRFVEHEGTTWQLLISTTAVQQWSPAAQLTVTQDNAGLVAELELHHALYDAVSLPMIVSAFERACRRQMLARRTGRDTLANFIDATRGERTSQARKTFWTEYLSGGHRTTNTTRSSFESWRVEVVRENAVEDTTLLVSQIAAADVSLQAAFLAVVGRTYARRLDFPRDSVVIGVYLANRGLDVDGLDVLAAPTVSVIPLVVDTRSTLLESARQVQRDLAQVQRAEHCGVTLREIYGWTGVIIDCFVNFVPRVEATSDDDNDDEEMYGGGDGEDGKVRLVPYPHETRDVSAEQRGERTSPFLSPAPTTEMPWCVPSVDIEAKIEIGGGLTMGLFAPKDRMDERAALEMLEEIGEDLVSFQQA